MLKKLRIFLHPLRMQVSGAVTRLTVYRAATHLFKINLPSGEGGGGGEGGKY